MVRPSYIKSLDGIRGLAVLLVICHHWQFNFFNIPFGWIGVQLFFVLSGFLITGILLSEKQLSLGMFLKRFYVKRALRIFPLYFGLLSICAVLFTLAGTVLSNKSAGMNLLSLLDELQVNSLFLVTYTYNFMEIYHTLISHIKIPNTELFSHLWSLSVEEQFYLVFPFIIYFLSEKNLKRFLVIILIVCPILRFACVELFKNFTTDYYFIGTVIYRQTPFQFDALCFGAALAVFDLKFLLKNSKLIFYLFLILTVSVGLINYALLHTSVNHVTLKGLGYEYTENLVYGNRISYGLTLINICSALMIYCSINGNSPFRMFENSKLIFIGKISYGIYLLHYPFLKIYRLVLSHFLTEEKINANLFLETSLFITYLICLVALASASYYLFEIKFLKLKEKISNQESERSTLPLPSSMETL